MMTRGFSLVEMSIVLVIIALLIGGVLMGESLLRSAQLINVTVEVNQFIQAAEMFQQKYNSLPGDMYNATNFWGVAGGNASDNYTTSCYASVGTGTQTCNGNGDGRVHDWPADLANGSDTDFPEMYLFWQQLANAQFIPGSFTGRPGPAGPYAHVPGTNAPASKLPGGGYQMNYLGAGVPDGVTFSALYNHVLILGAPAPGNGMYGPLLTASEAFAIDSKIDDGRPDSGTVMASAEIDPYDPDCTAYPNFVYIYNTSSSGPQCKLFFITGF